jgi:hypothetical protein
MQAKDKVASHTRMIAPEGSVNQIEVGKLGVSNLLNNN